MNLDKFSSELATVKASYQRRNHVIGGAIVQVGAIDHELGHSQQALLNIVEGLATGTMTESRATEILKKISERIDNYSEILLEATQR